MHPGYFSLSLYVYEFESTSLPLHLQSLALTKYHLDVMLHEMLTAAVLSLLPIQNVLAIKEMVGLPELKLASTENTHTVKID